MEKKQFDTIVVGGGIGGLTAAAYLVKHGYDILLCEKNSKTGGLVSGFCRQGFYFDAGIRAFENSGAIIPMVKQLGLEVEFLPNPVKIGFGDDLIDFVTDDSIHDYANLLKKHFADNSSDIDKIVAQIIKIMGYMRVIYKIDNPLFSDSLKDKEYLFKTLLPWLLKYSSNMKKASKLDLAVNEFLSKYTDNQALVDMITQHFFQNTPTFFALSYFGMYSEYMYPIGGTTVLADKLTKYFVSMGGTIVTDCMVSEVDIASHIIKSSSNEEYSYNKLVWAADMRTLYKCANPIPIKANIFKNAVMNSQGADSVFSVYIASDISNEELADSCGAHCFYTPKTEGLTSRSNELFDNFESKIYDYLEYTTYEISCPSVRDATLAPEGKSSIIISTLMDYNTVKQIQDNGNYSSFKEQCAERIIKIIDRYLIKGLRDKTVFYQVSTPLSIEKFVGSYQGSLTGWKFGEEFMPAETRFSKIMNSIKTPFQDIYQVGQWTFNPAGIPICLITGKIASDKINKELTKIKRRRRL